MRARKTSQDRKAEILDATLDLAFEVGPDNVTTGQIAARLGLTQPAIYKHFPKKDDIWQAVTDMLRARILDNIDAAAQANVPPLATVRRLALGHLHLVARTPALPEIMATRDPAGTLAPTRQAIHAAMSRFRAALHHGLDAARQAGQLRPEIEVSDGAVLLFGIVQSLVLRVIVSRDPALIGRDGARLIDLQLALMAAEPGQKDIAGQGSA